MNKCQLSMEFLIYVGIVLIITTIIFAFVSNFLLAEKRDDDLQIMKEVADGIATEIHLASTVEDGYFREFDIPPRVNGKQYTLELKNKTIILKVNNYEHNRYVDAQTTGNLVKGINNISNQGGVVNLNS